MASRKEVTMNIKINKITVHSFKNFHELTYKVGSGRLYGRSGEGKTNLLTAITACFVNYGLDGHKLVPLPDDAKTGWVKIEYDADGESQEAYRTWTRTDTGFTAASSITKKMEKSLFLAIANPMYVFELENSDRIDLIIDSKYFNFKGDIANELGSDLPVNIVDFLNNYDDLTIAKLRNMLKQTRLNMKAAKKKHETINLQLLILEEVENAYELVADLSAQAIALESEIQKQEELVCVIESINALLLKNAVESINSELCLTRFTEDGHITFSDIPADRLSSGEQLDCGLDIANVIAGRYDVVPPTIIDNATAFGHSNIDMSSFPNLSQIITASFADVDLCEHNNNMLYGLDKSWKNKAVSTFRPEVCIEMIPYHE